MPIVDITEYDSRVYREQLEDFLPDRFIDCHTHIWKKGTRKKGEKLRLFSFFTVSMLLFLFVLA